MKRKLSVVLILFLALFSLLAKTLPERVMIGAGNDKWRMGITRNLDDQLSYTEHLRVFYPKWHVSLDMESITNRGYTDVDDSAFYRGRYDVMALTVGIPMPFMIGDNWALNVEPVVGIEAFGDFRLDVVQNYEHKIKHVDITNMHYESLGKKIVPIGEVSFNFQYEFMPKLSAGFEVVTSYSAWYESVQFTAFNSSVGNEGASFRAYVGYDWIQTHTDNVTQKLRNQAMSGFEFGFNLDTGLFGFEYIAYPESRFGYGILYLDLMGFSEGRRTWKSSDLNVSMGFSWWEGSPFCDNQIEYSLGDKLALVLNNRYVSGFKTSPYIDVQTLRVERDYMMNSLGLKFSPWHDLLGGWVVPYVEAAAGVASFRICELRNHVPSAVEPFNDLGYKLFLEMEGTVGLTLIPEGKLRFSGASYMFSVFAGLVYIPSYENAGSYIKQDHYRDADWSLGPVQPRVGFAGKLGLDF